MERRKYTSGPPPGSNGQDEKEKEESESRLSLRKLKKVWKNKRSHSALSPRSKRGKEGEKEGEHENDASPVRRMTDAPPQRKKGRNDKRASKTLRDTGHETEKPQQQEVKSEDGERYDRLGRKLKKKTDKPKEIRPLKIEIVAGACSFIEQKGVAMSGILRKRGDEVVAKRLLNKFYRIEWDRILSTERRVSPHDMANALKMYIVKSHQPLIPVERYNEFMETYESKRWLTRLTAIKELVDGLPPNNRLVLKRIIELLTKVDEHRDKNSMNTLELSVVFGGILLQAPDPTRDVVMQRMMQCQLVQYFMLNYEELFWDPIETRGRSPTIERMPEQMPALRQLTAEADGGHRISDEEELLKNHDKLVREMEEAERESKAAEEEEAKRLSIPMVGFARTIENNNNANKQDEETTTTTTTTTTTLTATEQVPEVPVSILTVPITKVLIIESEGGGIIINRPEETLLQPIEEIKPVEVEEAKIESLETQENETETTTETAITTPIENNNGGGGDIRDDKSFWEMIRAISTTPIVGGSCPTPTPSTTAPTTTTPTDTIQPNTTPTITTPTAITQPTTTQSAATQPTTTPTPVTSQSETSKPAIRNEYFMVVPVPTVAEDAQQPKEVKEQNEEKEKDEEKEEKENKDEKKEKPKEEGEDNEAQNNKDKDNEDKDGKDGGSGNNNSSFQGGDAQDDGSDEKGEQKDNQDSNGDKGGNDNQEDKGKQGEQDNQDATTTKDEEKEQGKEKEMKEEGEMGSENDDVAKMQRTESEKEILQRFRANVPQSKRMQAKTSLTTEDMELKRRAMRKIQYLPINASTNSLDVKALSTHKVASHHYNHPGKKKTYYSPIHGFYLIDDGKPIFPNSNATIRKSLPQPPTTTHNTTNHNNNGFVPASVSVNQSNFNTCRIWKRAATNPITPMELSSDEADDRKRGRTWAGMHKARSDSCGHFEERGTRKRKGKEKEKESETETSASSSSPRSFGMHTFTDESDSSYALSNSSSESSSEDENEEGEEQRKENEKEKLREKVKMDDGEDEMLMMTIEEEEGTAKMDKGKEKEKEKKSDEELPFKPHNFKRARFNPFFPTMCGACKGWIFTIKKGYVCKDCSFPCHLLCIENVTQTCERAKEIVPIAGLKIGELAPLFTLKDHGGREVSLADILDEGKSVVLFFYPKDFTPGCIREAKAFRDKYHLFFYSNCEIIGISSDTQACHYRFINKYGLPFKLLCDPKGEVRSLYKVPDLLGGLQLARVTYVISSIGTIVHVYNSPFKPAEHVIQSLQAVSELLVRDASEDGFRISRQNLLDLKLKDDKYFSGRFWQKFRSSHDLGAYQRAVEAEMAKVLEQQEARTSSGGLV